jgi:orotidine-5'-phosphate decarboxylase
MKPKRLEKFLVPISKYLLQGYVCLTIIVDDQQRVCTPLESIKNGSDKIIMGRSLIKGNIEENLNQVSRINKNINICQ